MAVGVQSEENEPYLNLHIVFESEEENAYWQAQALAQASEKFVSGYKKMKVTSNNILGYPTDYLWTGMLDGSKLKGSVIFITIIIVFGVVFNKCNHYLCIGKSIDNGIQWGWSRNIR